MHRRHTPDAARRSEDGQTMAEYAVVLTVITLAILLTIQMLGDAAGDMLETVAELLG